MGLTTSRAFFVGDVNIFGMRLFIQIRHFFVNNRNVFVLGLFSLTGSVPTSPNLAKEGARSATINNYSPCGLALLLNLVK